MSQDNAHGPCSGCRVSSVTELSVSGHTAEPGMDRRKFLAQSGILAAMAALAACGSSSDATAPTVAANSQINISSYPALANVGGVAMVNVGNAPIAIVRTSSTAFIALSRVCPHQGGIVNESGTRFVCPVHGATFDLNGKWTGGERTSSLHQYATTYAATANTLTIS